MYLSGTQYTEADFTAVIQQLHGYAASIADSKQRFQQTGDTRYLQSVQTMIPYFRQALSKANTINLALSGEEAPSELSTFLTDTLGWLADAVAQVGSIGGAALTTIQKTVEATGDTAKKIPGAIGNLTSFPVLLLIAGAAFLFVGGGKFLPKRKA